MNYEDLTNAFERWLKTNSLPSLAQLLWYKLIYLFKECGWREWVTVDNRRLMSEVQINNEKTFIKHRDKLIESKLFDYKKGKKGSPNQYKINTVNFTVQSTVNSTVNNTVKTTVQSTDIKVSNNKESKKENEKRLTFNQLIENYTQNKELQQELKNHLVIRKKNGSLTNRSIELGFEHLSSLTKEIKIEDDKDKEKIKIVQQSIANGWSGFFKIKKEIQHQTDAKRNDKYEYDFQKQENGDLSFLYENL